MPELDLRRSPPRGVLREMLSPNGTIVIATAFSGRHIRVYDAATAAEQARIEIGEGSAHTTFDPDGRTAFIGCSISDHLAAIDLNTGQSLGTIHSN